MHKCSSCHCLFWIEFLKQMCQLWKFIPGIKGKISKPVCIVVVWRNVYLLNLVLGLGFLFFFLNFFVITWAGNETKPLWWEIEWGSLGRPKEIFWIFLMMLWLVNVDSPRDFWVALCRLPCTSRIWVYLLWFLDLLHLVCEKLGSLAKPVDVELLNCIWLCEYMDCSTPGLPVPHHLPEFTQVYVCWVSDASNHLSLCCDWARLVLNLLQIC